MSLFFANAAAALAAALFTLFCFRLIFREINPEFFLTILFIIAACLSVIAVCYKHESVSTGVIIGLLLGSTCFYFFRGDSKKEKT